VAVASFLVPSAILHLKVAGIAFHLERPDTAGTNQHYIYIAFPIAQVEIAKDGPLRIQHIQHALHNALFAL
jgi:hypothetical protein